MRTTTKHLATTSLAALAMANPLPGADATLQPRADQLTNPVIYQDYPDLDVFRVGSVFYYSSSTFAYSPGAPVLRSYDLASWEPVSHSVPTLSFADKFNLDGERAYVDGIYASTMRYRESNDMFYWMGCIDYGKTHVFTAPGNGAADKGGEVDGWEWTEETPIDQCYYDMGLLIDDDDAMYVAYGNSEISVAKLSDSGLAEERSEVVFSSDAETIEGARMYKVDGYYYIFVTRPADAEFVLRSESPWGPYEMKDFVVRISGPLESAGFAHQGGIVDTDDGDWYYVGFMDAYPGGRIPVVAPFNWVDGWPELVTDNGNWGVNYPIPVQTDKTVASSLGTDEFEGSALSHEWEWNHNPENSKWSLAEGGGLVLQTVDVTTDLYSARNTLTRRIIGPKSTGTFRLDVSAMADGDRAGAVLFRDRSAYIGVWKEGGASRLVMLEGLTLDQGSWDTSSEGTVAEEGPELGDSTEVWLRVEADITPSFNNGMERTTTFSYSFDGAEFTRLGPEFAMSSSWEYFTGYRYGVFNHATADLGGELLVKSFTMELAE